MGRACQVIRLCGLAVLLAAVCVGQQHTEVRDAGGGRKIELIYDAAGQVAETHTLDAAGTLQTKVEHEYRPGFYVPQETTTVYWPDGKSVRSVTRVEYDENANFTGETIRLFDESGAQTGGTRLAHDPFTGVYRCFKWSPSSHSDQSTECPATEESGKAPEQAHKLSREEAIVRLRQARQALREQKTNVPAQTSTATEAAREIGIILPAQLRPGERVSGSIVAGTKSYTYAPGLTLIRMELPVPSSVEGATLHSWTLEVGTGLRQPADRPISFSVPHTKQVTLTLRDTKNPGRTVSHSLTVSNIAAPKNPPKATAFEAPALCLKGGVCPVRGAFSGDSTKTFAAFGTQPAAIIAESEEIAYVSMPSDVPPGPTDFILNEGAQLVAFPLDVADLAFTPPRRDVRQGETLLVHAVLSGPEKLPEDMWKKGTFASAVEGCCGTSGFEPQEREAGTILLVIRNAAPETVSFRKSKNETFSFELTPDSFENGEFKYHFAVEAAKTGAFAIEGRFFPFLAPVRGEAFRIADTEPDK
jgi:hypothetical protein